MDVIVAVVLGIIGLIAIIVVFYARQNDLTYLIRSPGEALFFVHRQSLRNGPQSQSESSDQSTRLDVDPQRHGRDSDIVRTDPAERQ